MSLGDNPSVDINLASAGEDGEIMDLRKEMDKIRAELEALAITRKIANKFSAETRAKIVPQIDTNVIANRKYLKEVLAELRYRDEDCDEVVEEPTEDKITEDRDKVGAPNNVVNLTQDNITEMNKRFFRDNWELFKSKKAA